MKSFLLFESLYTYQTKLHASYIPGSDIGINDKNMEEGQNSVYRLAGHHFEVVHSLDIERALRTELDLNSSTEEPLSTGVVPFLKVLEIYNSNIMSEKKYTWIYQRTKIPGGTLSTWP